MSTTLNKVLNEIDDYRESFHGITSKIFQNNLGNNQKSKKRAPSSTASLTEEQARGSGSSRKSLTQSRTIPFPNELPADIPIPNSVVRNNSFDIFRKGSTSSEQSNGKKLSKDDIRALIAGAVTKEIENENETSKKIESFSEQLRKTPANKIRRSSKLLEMERRLSMRRSSEFDKRKSMLRSVRRTSEEEAPEIRPSLLEEIRTAIQKESTREKDEKQIMADKHLDEESEISKDSKKSDMIAPSNAWLEHITERLTVSSRRVSELSNKIAATRKSSMLSVDSDDSATWSQRMNDGSWDPSKSKQSMSERLRIVENKSSKQSRDRQFGTPVASKTSRSNNVSRDSRSRLKRVGSPSVLSDRSSFTHRSEEYSSSRGRKTRSADKERRNSFSNIKVGPAMMKHLEQENMKIKGSKSNLSPTHSRSYSFEKMKEVMSRSSGTKLMRRSKTAIQNNSNERLNKRSRSNCSMGDTGFNPADKKSSTKRSSLTDLIDLYYSSPTRRSTYASLRKYRDSIVTKDRDSVDLKMKDSKSKVVKTPESSLENNDDSWFPPDTPLSSTRSIMSIQGRMEDKGDVDEKLLKTAVKSIIKNVDEDNGSKKLRDENVEDEKKKKSEKGSRKLSLSGAEILVDSEEEGKQNKKNKSSQRRLSVNELSGPPAQRKSDNKEVINYNRRGSKLEHESGSLRKKLEDKKVINNKSKGSSLMKVEQEQEPVVEKNEQMVTAKFVIKNIDIKKRASMEKKNENSRQRFETKKTDEVDSKLENVQEKIKNNLKREEKHRISFTKISFSKLRMEDDKNRRVSVDKSSIKNKYR